MLRLGLATGADHLHLCDFDYALHWIPTYPDELGQTVAAIPSYDLLILGRTPGVKGTMHNSQCSMEEGEDCALRVGN